MSEQESASDFALHRANFADDCQRFDEWGKVTGWDTSYQQVGRGRFEGSLAVGFQEHVQVNRCVFNRELLIHASPPTDTVSFVVPYSFGPRGIVQGHELKEDDVIVVPSGVEGFLRTSPSLSYLVLMLPQELLERTLRKNDPARDGEIKEGGVLAFPKKDRANFLESMTMLLDHPESFSREDVLDNLASGFCHEIEETPGPLRLRNRLRYVRQAREYMDDRLSERLSISDVSGALGVNRRTLELSFQDVLGMTPLEYLRTRRLKAVRTELRRNQSEEKKVELGKLAARFGLLHASYFSRDYKALFGELPSAMLRS